MKQTPTLIEAIIISLMVIIGFLAWTAYGQETPTPEKKEITAKHQKIALERLDKASAKALAEYDKAMVKAIKEYHTYLDKAIVYYTKKGDFERAMICKKAKEKAVILDNAKWWNGDTKYYAEDKVDIIKGKMTKDFEKVVDLKKLAKKDAYVKVIRDDDKSWKIVRSTKTAKLWNDRDYEYPDLKELRGYYYVRSDVMVNETLETKLEIKDGGKIYICVANFAAQKYTEKGWTPTKNTGTIKNGRKTVSMMFMSKVVGGGVTEVIPADTYTVVFLKHRPKK